MAKRFTLVALLVVLLLLSACGIEPPVFVTATPEGTPQPTDAVSATVAPTIESSSTSVLNPSPTRQFPTNTPLPTATQIVSQSCSRLSYNVNGQGLQDETYLITHLDRINPCVLLVMDNFALAWRLAQRYPESVVVVRTYSRFEGGQCLQDSPQSQVDRFIAEANAFSSEAKSRLILYGCSNEPSYGGNNTLQQILNAEHTFMTYAKSKGVRVCSGNWGVGNFDPEQVEAGMYNQYLRDIADGNHYLCVHEYTSLFLPFGTGQYSRQCLIEGYQLNPPRNYCVQPQNWVTREQIQPRRIQLSFSAQSESDWANVPFGYEMMSNYYSLPSAQAANGVLPPYWHLFRVYWLYIIADENGIPRPQTIISECCHDNLADINLAEPRALDILKPIFGIERFTYDLRGAPSHCKLWESYYYPQWTCEQALLQQWLWWDSVADPAIIGFTAYTWSWHDHWISFDMSTRQFSMNVREFHRLFEACYGRVPHCQFTRAA
jgi:hypothetical protein